MTATTGNPEAARRTPPASLTALQCELRHLFATRPTNRALAESLSRIGRHLGAIYAVVHTRLGVHVLSEEWTDGSQQFDTEERERINQALWESVSTEEQRCVRMTADRDGPLLASVVMYDGGAEPSGGAAIVVPNCDRARVLQVMAWLEGILGYVALLLDAGDRSGGGRRIAERHQLQATAEAEHPTRLAYAILGELEARYGLELAAVGFVHGDGVRVTAMTGVQDVRAANPGVALVQAAMEECLDRREPIVYARGAENEADCRLHAQWSNSAQGNAVASLPLVCVGEVVAVVAMSQGGGTRLTREQVLLIAEELSGYAALVPLSLTANRSLLTHARDLLRRQWRRLWRRGKARVATLLLTAVAVLGWLMLGTLHHTFTVPCIVKPNERRTIACPRAGVLAELFARPGDRVREGQLLAAIDASDDFLQHAELRAEIESLAALIDQAVANRDAGEVRVNQARKRSLEAQLAIVNASIEQAQIKAPHDGLILQGDLRERLGSRLELGVPLFELARYDRASIELRIPERLVLAAHQAIEVEFAAAGEPDRIHRVEALRIAPSSAVVDEHNVFLGEGDVPIDLGRLPPGMEGTAHIDAGPRSAWWVLTHRVTNWLRLNFWL